METNKEANAGLYRHYGFDLMKEEFIPEAPVMYYAMIRHPKAHEICKPDL